jgi:hypothetical protein
MARRKTKEEQNEQLSETQAAIMAAPAVTVHNTAAGETESLWVWELED